MKKAVLIVVGVLVCVVGALGVGLSACHSSPAAALPGVEEAELLAGNTVLARFTGVQEQPCRFMTALCPDRCDHATKLATFTVVENLSYTKPGQYGDEKLSPGDTAVVDVEKPVLGQPADIAQRIGQLRPGQLVQLTLHHYYVKQGQGQFPVRPAVELKLR